MKFFKKNPIFSIVLGGLILIYAVLAFFIEKGFFSLTDTVGRVVISLGLLSFAFLIVAPDLKKERGKLLNAFQFVILIIAAVFGFILPLFDVKVANFGTGSLWFGLALIMNGGIGMYLAVPSKKIGNIFTFLVHLFSVIFGTWIYTVNYVDKNIKMITFIGMLAAGIALLLIGLLSNKKK